VIGTVRTPQHGSVISDRETIKHVFRLLVSLKNIRIDDAINNDYDPDFSNSLNLRKRRGT